MMTSMNFQAIGQQQAVTSQNKSLVLREGQVFHGSIKQLFPNQMAEVQVGTNKLVAKLETPLKAGDTHYFQVTNTSGQVELKVVTGPMAQATPNQQLSQLMDSMSLPKTAEMRQVMSHFIQNNLPMSKEQLVQAEAWLKAMPDAASKTVALQAMTRMVELKMPFTNDVFQALINGSKAVGINDAISNLAQRLLQDTQLNGTTKLNIQQQLQTIQQPLQQQVGANIMSSALATIFDTQAPMANKLESLLLLKQAGVVSQQATLSNLTSTQATTANSSTVSQLLNQLNNGSAANTNQLAAAVQTVISQDSTLTTVQKQQLTQMIQQFIQSPKTNESALKFTAQVTEQLLKANASNHLNVPATVNAEGHTAKDQMLALLKLDAQAGQQALTQLTQVASNSQSPHTQSMLANAELTVQANMDSQQIEQAMKTVLRSLGLSYEAVLNSGKGEQLEAVTNSLKPQLMNLLNDSVTPQPIRDAAEVLLARINGMQLLSSDNGMQHQIVMQVPLEFLGKKMEATLHWNGRMKEDGKIDSDFARVLFYLQMQSIDQTVIDMQVQNRIVSVTIYNEFTNLGQLASGLKGALAEGLEQKGYQLSGVQLKTFEKQAVAPKKQVQNEPLQQGGVDYRI